jgi:ABC-type phosphate transport system substrate-binding protein
MKKVILVTALILFIAANANAQVSIIANKSVSESALAANKVASIYSLETTKWSNGNKIVVFDNNSETKSGFYSGIGKDQLSLKKEWMKKQLTGEAKAPEAVGSDADVISKVASTPGAIGFVKSASVNGNVKVLCELK